MHLIRIIRETGGVIELETKFAEDYANFYHHRLLALSYLRHYAKQVITQGK